MGKRILATLVLAAVLAFCIAQHRGDGYAESVFYEIEFAATEHLDASLTNTLVAYGVARALNAGISVLQESEIDISPAGLGVTVAAGQVLDPLNDIIERFSWVLLVCAASLGVQRVLLFAGLEAGSGIFLPIALAIAILAVWAPRVGRISLRRLAATAVAASLMVMFAVPVATLANHWTYETFLAADYEASMDVVRASRDEIAPEIEPSSTTRPGSETAAPVADDADANPQDRPAPTVDSENDTSEDEAYIMDSPHPYPARPQAREETQGTADAENDRSFFEALRNALSGADEALDLRGRIDSLRAMLDKALDSIINLIVVFVLNSVVFPLLFLWVLITVARRLGRMVTAGAVVSEESNISAT